MVRSSRRSGSHKHYGVPSPNPRRTLRRNLKQTKKEENHFKLLLESLQFNGKSIADHILQKEKNIPENLLNCSICCSAYSKKRHLPLVGTCGHTICRQCVKSLRNRHCPICRVKNGFRKPAKNYAFYDLLDQMEKLSPVEEGDDSDVETASEIDTTEDEELSEVSAEDEAEAEYLYMLNPGHRLGGEEEEETDGGEVDEDDEDDDVDGEEEDDDEEEIDDDGIDEMETEDELEDEENDELQVQRPSDAYSLVEEIREEINAEFRGQDFRETRFLTEITGRIDYLWFLIYSYTLHGVSATRIANLRRKIHPNSPYYKDLQYGARVLLRWKLQQDEDPLIRAKMKTDEVHWRIDEQVAARLAGASVDTHWNPKLLAIYHLSGPFEPNSDTSTENEQRILNEISILHVIQYNEQRNNTITRQETPPWINDLFH